MKKLITLFALFTFVLGMNAQNIFEVGDKKVDFTIGVGAIRYADHTRATFDQHMNLEWGVTKLGERVTLGVGFAVNNNYGGRFESIISGKYDYKYTQTTSTTATGANSQSLVTKKEEVSRQGYGTANADITRDDINAMATVSFHFSPMKKLDTYVKVGLGIGFESYVIDNICGIEGFSAANENKLVGNNITVQYRYNDLDHTNWNEYDPKVTAAVAAYIGATYFFNEEWGLDAQVGMVSANLSNKSKNANAFGLFALGVAYKF